jgi:hypothetical protein
MRPVPVIIMEQTIKYHPFADIWPLLTGEPFKEFVADVAANGLRLPIIRYQGMILDGRNRYRACLETGVEPRFEDACVKDDRAALKLVVSLNDKRRHMTIEERSFAAAAMATLQVGGFEGNKNAARKTNSSPDLLVSKNQLVTQAEAAEIMKVSVPSVKRARAVVQHGTPELIADVKAGRVPLARAAASLDRGYTGKKTGPKVQKQDGPKAFKDMTMQERQVAMHQKFNKMAPLRQLTREQVDPDFKGTSLEFVRQYGHVNLRTKVEIDLDKAEQRAQAVVTWISDLVRTAPPEGDDSADFIAWLSNDARQRKMQEKLAKAAVLARRILALEALIAGDRV